MTLEPKEGDVIAVWFSCGAASAVALKRTVERYGNLCTIRVINNPVKQEDEDNRRFLRDVESWVGVTVEFATNERYPTGDVERVWDDEKAMSFPHGAPCTEKVKRLARQQWEAINHYDWIVMGFTVEEQRRHARFTLTERANVLPVLIDAGLTKADCFDIVEVAGIKLPDAYLRGYPNANCIGCVKASSPTYWNHVRKHDPDVFAARAEQSRRLGVKLVRMGGGARERLFLDELSPDAKAAPLKSLRSAECGIFCEERNAPTKPKVIWPGVFA